MEKTKKSAYPAWREKHKFSQTKENKKKFESVEKVRSDFEKARNARRSNCYWLAGQSDSSSSSNGGGDWISWWDKQKKQYLSWTSPSDSDNFQSNVKIPETTGRVEALMHQLGRVNLGWTAIPETENDEKVGKIAEIIMNYIFETAEVSPNIKTWTKNTLINGSGIARFVYQKDYRNYSRLKAPGELSAEEKKKLKSGEESAFYHEKKKTLVYEGFNLIPIPIEDLYSNAQAVNMHGKNYAATYCVWRRIMQIDEFKAEFGSLPNAHDVDKVKPSGAYRREDYSFFQMPEDVVGDDMVEVLEYENILDDEYIVVANDVEIINDPHPSCCRKKQLTFYKTDCIENPFQFYGIGIPDLLTHIQGASEITLNLMLDKMYRAMFGKYLVDTSILGEFSQAYVRPDNFIIPTNTLDGKSLAQKVMPLPSEPVSFDGFRMLEYFKEYATMATNVDPAQMNLQQAGQTATSSVLSRDLVDAMVGAILDNLAVTCKHIGRECWETVRSKWAVPKIKEIVGDDGKIKKIKKNRVIRLNGEKIVNEGGELELKKVNKKYSYFEVSKKELESEEDISIRISPESLEIISRGLEKRKVQEAYSQLMPNAVDPTDPAKVSAHPLPLYDARILAKKFVDKVLDGDDELLLNSAFDEDEDLDSARDHVRSILEGKYVSGTPGVSDTHLNYERVILATIGEQITELLEKIKKTVKLPKPQFDPVTGMQSEPEPQFDPILVSELEKLENVRDNLAKHFATDSLPKYAANDVALTEAAAMKKETQPPPPPPSEPPSPVQNVPMPEGGGLGGVTTLEGSI